MTRHEGSVYNAVCQFLGSSVDDSVCSLSESLVKISPEEYSVPIDTMVIRELNSLPVLAKLSIFGNSVLEYSYY